MSAWYWLVICLMWIQSSFCFVFTDTSKLRIASIFICAQRRVKNTRFGAIGQFDRLKTNRFLEKGTNNIMCLWILFGFLVFTKKNILASKEYIIYWTIHSLSYKLMCAIKHTNYRLHQSTSRTLLWLQHADTYKLWYVFL